MTLHGDCNSLKVGDILSLGTISDNAHSVARSTDIRKTLEQVLSQSLVNRILAVIRSLGRISAACDTFVEIAGCLSSFSNIKIILLSNPQAGRPAYSSVEEASILVEDCLRDSKSALPSWIWQDPHNDKRKKFNGLFKQPHHVHAEMQMLFFGCYPVSKRGMLFPYIDLSKKTCLLCGHILASVKEFESRGNHGKIYPSWTLPREA